MLRSQLSGRNKIRAINKQLLVSQRYTVVGDKKQKKLVVIGVAILADSNIRKKEREERQKYRVQKRQLEQMWKE